VTAIRELNAQRYSEVFRVGAKGKGLIVEIDLQLTFSFLVEMKGCRRRFCNTELKMPGLEVFIHSIVDMSLLCTPSTAYYNGVTLLGKISNAEMPVFAYQKVLKILLLVMTSVTL